MTPAFLQNVFIFTVKDDPALFVSVVVTVVVSVVLHELGHGFAALREGDDTPRITGHMTLNPLVHMGGLSLVILLLAGIAWGQMPVNPSRFRHRYSSVIVSLAGPAVNLVLALLALTIWGLWLRFAGAPETDAAQGIGQFLWVFGLVNLALFLLNLLPIPPLDGSRVLGGVSRSYARWMADPNNQGVFLILFVGIFLGAQYLFEAAGWAAGTWIRLLSG